MENVQKIIIPGQGQTSDREISVVERKYFELPEDFPEIPAGYEQWKQEKRVDRVCDFFTYEDYIYVVRKIQRSFSSFYFLYKNTYLYLSSSSFGTITVCTSCFCKYWTNKYSPEDFLKIPYRDFRRFVLEKLNFYDFVNETELPDGLSSDFKISVEAVDGLNVDIQKNFLKIAAYLKLLNLYSGNFEKFGCKDVYQFAERRWGYGSTSVKNFLAIAEKFMSGQELLPAAEGYGYSQLVELSSVPEGALSEFNSKMTIQEIRKKKKEVLEGDSSKEEKEKAPRKEKEIDVFKTSLRAFFWGFRIPYDDPGSSGYKVYRKALREVVQKLNSEFGLGISTNF